MDSVIFNKAFNLVVENVEKDSNFKPILIIVDNESYIHDGTTLITFQEISKNIIDYGVSNNYFEKSEKNGEYKLTKRGKNLKKSGKSLKNFEKKYKFTFKSIESIITIIVAIIGTIFIIKEYYKDDTNSIKIDTNVNVNTTPSNKSYNSDTLQ